MRRALVPLAFAFAFGMRLSAPALAGVHALAPTVAPAIVPLAPLAPPPPAAPLNLAPIPLPLPPNSAAIQRQALLSALLAIAQAQRVDPGAAQTAAFAYRSALSQYGAGDRAAADRSLLRAISIASQAQVAPVAEPAPQPSTGPTAGGAGVALYGAAAGEVDADSFLALARGTTADCIARHDRRAGTARAALARAERDFAATDWQATRVDAKAAIDACAPRNR
jgi:hypothetical protein